MCPQVETLKEIHFHQSAFLLNYQQEGLLSAIMPEKSIDTFPWKSLFEQPMSKTRWVI